MLKSGRSAHAGYLAFGVRIGSAIVFEPADEHSPTFVRSGFGLGITLPCIDCTRSDLSTSAIDDRRPIGSICPQKLFRPASPSSSLSFDSHVAHHCYLSSLSNSFETFSRDACGDDLVHSRSGASDTPRLDERGSEENLRYAVARPRLSCSERAQAISRSEQSTTLHAHEHQKWRL